MNRRLTIMSKFVRRMRAQWLERPRQPVLERPHRARRTHVLASPAPLTPSVNLTMCCSPRSGPIDDRNQNPARPNQAAKRLARRLDEAMNHDPIDSVHRLGDARIRPPNAP